MTGNAPQAYGQCSPAPIAGDDGWSSLHYSFWELGAFLPVDPTLGVLAPLVDQRELDDRWGVFEDLPGRLYLPG